MSLDSGEKGIALLLDLTGRITEVLRDDFAMLAGRIDEEGRFCGEAPRFSELLQAGSQDKAESFLELIRTEGVAFKWEFIVESGAELPNQNVPHHFAGGMLCNQIIVLGARTPDLMSRFYNEFISLTLEQAAQLRQAVSGPGPERPDRRGDQNESLYEEFSRLNNELVNVQRALHKKNSELERLNSEKNLFLGMAAHDLRNPLGVIYSYGEFIGEALGKDCKSLCTDDCESLKEMAETIVDSSGFMLSMVNELLDVTRIEAGRIELSLQVVDLVGLFERNVTLNRVLAEHHGVHVTFHAAAGFPRVVVDPNKLTQVLNNLIANAVRHSTKGGVVRVVLEREDGHVVLRVADQGKGVVEADRENIFKPFVQLQEGGKGAGLGLAIVRRIVEGHGGDIWVTGEPGQGASFNVRFPLHVGDERGSAGGFSSHDEAYEDKGGEPAGIAGSLRILVADDELLNRTLLERILTNHGHEVVTAEDGDIALDLAEREKPDVLLLDLSMPAMDGMEVLQTIRSGKRDISASTPVIVLTGYDEKDVDTACREFGVVDVVTKPISMNTLLKVIARITPRRKD